MDEPSNHQVGLTNVNNNSPPNNTSHKTPVSQIIANQIRKAIKPSPSSRRDPEAFVLESSLREILSQKRVQQVLDEIHDQHPEKPNITLDDIFNTSRDAGRLKILATLVYHVQANRLYDFIDSNIWDSDLPVTDSNRVFKDWPELFCDGFVARQYLFLAPIIDFECMKHKVFEGPIPMPFLDLLNGPDKGAHGQVSKVRIHQDYQKWGERTRCDDRCYAVKRFTGKDHEFDQEREALLRFSHPKKGHESLIELLYSYELRSTKYFIFPCAEGDLEHHWMNHKADPTSSNSLIWMLEQCHGIACGLERVHSNPSFRKGDIGGSRSRGRHGDIKPKNILFFKDEENPPGRLVVADFTLMRFHSSSADYTQMENVGFSETYRPPEKAVGGGTQVSQKYDIWTLGCVFLEFVTWFLLGSDAVRPPDKGRGFMAPDGKEREDFGTSRQRDDDNYRDDKFFNSVGLPTPILKESVVDWIKYLRGHKCSSKALCQFLDLIEDEMLVVTPERRHSMLQVMTTTAGILSAAKSSPDRCQPLRRLNLLHSHSFPNLLEPRPPKDYWPLVTLPQPESVPTTVPQNPDYVALEDAFLTPDREEALTAEGWLEVPARDDSSVGRPSNSFITGSSMLPRESVDYVTPATTRQPSVRDRSSYDRRRLEIPQLGTNEGNPENVSRVENANNSIEPPRRTRRQRLKHRVMMWKRRIKSRLHGLTRFSPS